MPLGIPFLRAETAEPSEEGVQAAEQGHNTARGGPGLVSAREARDLQQLLDMFSMGYSDVEDFQARLDSELGALEVGSCWQRWQRWQRCAKVACELS